MTQSDANDDLPASARITARIAALGDWRGDTLARMRALIHEADPDVVEEWKWMGTPVWSHGGRLHNGILCTGESYKDKVKLTLPRARRCRTRPVCSTRAWTATCAARSISTRAKPSMRTRSRR